jgi:cytidyltransferase-like protein
VTVAAIVGKFRPIHLGHQKVLEELCDAYDHVIIGIGSSNRYTKDVPFTAQETEDMLGLVLAGRTNYTLIHVPDYGHMPEYKDGTKWQDELVKQLDSLGGIDVFVTGNPYVASLISDRYRIIAPKIEYKLSSSIVRHKIASGEDWHDLVSREVDEYITKRGLDIRLRQEFGNELIKNAPAYAMLTKEKEMQRVMQDG